MLRAGSLFIVIVISLITGILCSSLILISYYQRMQVLKDLKIKQALLNIDSGINILLADHDGIPYHTEIAIDLFGGESDSIIIRKETWGVFETALVMSFNGNHRKAKSVLLGYKPDKLRNAAIYLSQQNSPLSLAGNTIIKGDCYLPVLGVKRATIGDRYFSRSRLVEGEIYQSTISIPEVNSNLVNELLILLHTTKENYQGNYEIFAGKDLPDTLSRSFFERPLLVCMEESYSLKNKNLRGNIIICSPEHLEIDSTSKLSDIQIFARAVSVKKYFSGNLQIIASDSLVVDQNCRFQYPSALGILKTYHTAFQPYLSLKEDVVVKGIVFSKDKVVQDERQVLIKLEKTAEVEGEIYSDGLVDLKGKVGGTVLCEKFLLKTPAAVYENHLMDAVIDAQGRSRFYVGSGLIAGGSKKGIVKWLE